MDSMSLFKPSVLLFFFLHVGLKFRFLSIVSCQLLTQRTFHCRPIYCLYSMFIPLYFRPTPCCCSSERLWGPSIVFVSSPPSSLFLAASNERRWGWERIVASRCSFSSHASNACVLRAKMRLRSSLHAQMPSEFWSNFAKSTIKILSAFLVINRIVYILLSYWFLYSSYCVISLNRHRYRSLHQSRSFDKVQMPALNSSRAMHSFTRAVIGYTTFVIFVRHIIHRSLQWRELYGCVSNQFFDFSSTAGIKSRQQSSTVTCNRQAHVTC